MGLRDAGKQFFGFVSEPDAFYWDNISGEIKNMIFLDDVRYMLKDKNNVIVINATNL